MWWLLQWIFCGHMHKWKIIKEQPTSRWEKTPENIVAKGTLYHLQCEHCGAIKFKDNL